MDGTPRADEVHLWRAPLDVSAPLGGRLAETLSEDERGRAARRHDPTHRSRYVTGRGWLRLLLARYLDADPATLAFVADAHGKPRLVTPSEPWLRFNLSHSGPIVVFAVACDRDVGVDVEQIRDGIDVEGIARRAFTAGQRGRLAELAPPARSGAFFAMWTRNEAYLKARGTGLAGGRRDLDVPSGWLVTEFDAGAGYCGAVAVEGDGVEVPLSPTDLTVRLTEPTHSPARSRGGRHRSP